MQITRWQASGGQWYMAVCVDTRHGRAGIVINGTSETKTLQFAYTMPNRIGYVSCNSFNEAVKRAGMMERDERNAWGVITQAE